MNPKARPIVLVIVLTVLAIAVLHGQPVKNCEQPVTETTPDINVLLNFNLIVR